MKHVGHTLLAFLFIVILMSPAHAEEPCVGMSGEALLTCLTDAFTLIRDEGAKEELFNSMTPQQILDVQTYLGQGPLVATVESHEPTEGEAVIYAPSFGPNYGCRQVIFSLTKTDAIGTWLWRYSQLFDWCYNGKIIKTRADASPIVQIFFPFWYFRGNILNQTSGGVGLTYFNSILQGDFEFCFVGSIGCIYSVTPYHNHTVKPKGLYQ